MARHERTRARRFSPRQHRIGTGDHDGRAMGVVTTPVVTSDLQPEAFDDDVDWENPDCTWCQGDGDQECDDPLGCTRRHDEFGSCECSACGGSGLAKDQTIW